METTNDPALATEADARVLDAAAAILRTRFGKLMTGDLISGLESAAVTLRANGGIIKPAVPEPVPAKPKEGWGVIRPGDRKAHYYVDTMALCRRVGFYQGPLEADNGPSRDDHKECRRLLTRRQAAAAVVIPAKDPS